MYNECRNIRMQADPVEQRLFTSEIHPPIQKPIMDRLCDMIRADGVLLIQIRDRPRELKDALVGAHAES